jgi:dTMP kinase
VDPYLVAMLYAGDRKDASTTLTNWLTDGKIVLLDRYTYSNIAYQCAKLEEISEQDKLMNWILSLEFIHFAIPKPNLNIFLDVPFAFAEKNLTKIRTGNDRNYLNGTKDIHEESLVFQKKVRDLYLRVSASDDHLAVVECINSDGAMLTPSGIFELIIKIFKERKLV